MSPTQRSARFFRRTRALTPWLRLGKIRARLEFKPADLWIGFYGSPDETWGTGSLWICLIPCLPVHIDWWAQG